MDPQIKVVDNKLMCIKNNHGELILLVVTDDQVPFSDRFLCSKCIQTHQNVYNKLMPIQSAIELIKERRTKQNQKQEEQREKSLKIIKQFQLSFNQLQSQIMQLFNEIQRITQVWITDLKKLKQNDDLLSIIKQFEYFNYSEQNIEKNDIMKNNKAFFIKLDQKYQKLLDLTDYQTCYNILKKTVSEEKGIRIKEINQQQLNQQQESQQVKIKEKQIIKDQKVSIKEVKLIQSFESRYSKAMSFNHNGNIMVQGCYRIIKVYKFENEKLSQLQTLEGHTDDITCIVFSQKTNWFISGSQDNNIRCWGENNQQWKCQNTVTQHVNIITCLIMNRNENQLISCSLDKTIVIWKIDNQRLKYQYTLEQRHTDHVISISLNESETALVSCSQDKSIILWIKNKDDKWIYQHYITNGDYGNRICFIDDNQIIWQQDCKGISHIFQIENGKLIPIPEQNIELNKETVDMWLFPTIVNKQKQIIIQKHNKYVYILQRQQNGRLQLSYQPMDQDHHQNYGTLSNDGQYLVLWSYGNKELRVYRIIYG